MSTWSPPEPRVSKRKRLLLILGLLLLLLLALLFVVAFRMDGERIVEQILGLILPPGGKGPKSVTKSEISGMTSGLGSFKSQFNVTYVPSQIRLREDGAYNMNNQIEKDTVTFLQAMFGKRLDLRPVNASIGAGNDWNGNGTLDGPVTLTGDQCLVFFLGGIPNTGTPADCLGFSTSPSNPTTPGGNRISQFFEFKSHRLVRGANGFLSYTDGFGKNVYAYFSSYKTANGYNRYGSSDCANLGVSPYILSTSPTIFANATDCQIISAGVNGAFGAGGTTWDPSTGYPPGDPGADDLSNISSALLGAPMR